MKNSEGRFSRVHSWDENDERTARLLIVERNRLRDEVTRMTGEIAKCRDEIKSISNQRIAKKLSMSPRTLTAMISKIRNW